RLTGNDKEETNLESCSCGRLAGNCWRGSCFANWHTWLVPVFYYRFDFCKFKIPFSEGKETYKGKAICEKGFSGQDVSTSILIKWIENTNWGRLALTAW